MLKDNGLILPNKDSNLGKKTIDPTRGFKTQPVWAVSSECAFACARRGVCVSWWVVACFFYAKAHGGAL